jgi:hypothetical protein
MKSKPASERPQRSPLYQLSPLCTDGTAARNRCTSRGSRRNVIRPGRSLHSSICAAAACGIICLRALAEAV